MAKTDKDILRLTETGHSREECEAKTDKQADDYFGHRAWKQTSADWSHQSEGGSTPAGTFTAIYQAKRPVKIIVG